MLLKPSTSPEARMSHRPAVLCHQPRAHTTAKHRAHTRTVGNDRQPGRPWQVAEDTQHGLEKGQPSTSASHFRSCYSATRVLGSPDFCTPG